jgi:hypothetical protein
LLLLLDAAATFSDVDMIARHSGWDWTAKRSKTHIPVLVVPRALDVSGRLEGHMVLKLPRGTTMRN